MAPLTMPCISKDKTHVTKRSDLGECRIDHTFPNLFMSLSTALVIITFTDKKFGSVFKKKNSVIL